MRTCCLSLNILLLLFAASALSAQTYPLRLCVSQNEEGYDALKLSLALSSRRLKSGASLAIVAITGKELRPEDAARELRPEERRSLTDPSTLPFARLLLTEKSEKARNARIEQLGCDYNIKVFFHQSAEIFDSDGPGPGPAPNEDRTYVEYELRKAGSKKLLERSSAPPRTIFVRQGRRLFDPYALFADQIIKKLDSIRPQPTGRQTTPA